ncbi:MAG: glycosyl hydrolase, partial [Gammaproteobacteria bacterium]|nr:glycosyl hydrolase [Gammaproteobacteria bacterium]
MSTTIPKVAACFAALFVVTAIPVTGLAQNDTDYDVDPALYQALEWRNIGPFRGGRVTAVAGHPDQPFVYYMGATGGGVWKTINGGVSWANVSDGFFNTGTIGAIAVAESDPNVIYVGTGESPVRGVSTSHGDGVYKSSDAGKTWEHVGLTKTRQISKITVHPTNPDIVYVGAQGSPWAATEERGVYRSTDGGA